MQITKISYSKTTKKEKDRQYIFSNNHQTSKVKFYDYNIESKEQNIFLSATCFFPLWAKLASQEQADKMIEKHLKKLIFQGGIAGCSPSSILP